MTHIRSIGELERAALDRTKQDRTAFLRKKAQELRATMRCNCDLDNWEPEPSTGHSWVCRIHKAAIAAKQ